MVRSSAGNTKLVVDAALTSLPTLQQGGEETVGKEGGKGVEAKEQAAFQVVVGKKRKSKHEDGGKKKKHHTSKRMMP